MAKFKSLYMFKPSRFGIVPINAYKFGFLPYLAQAFLGERIQVSSIEITHCFTRRDKSKNSNVLYMKILTPSLQNYVHWTI